MGRFPFVAADILSGSAKIAEALIAKMEVSQE